MTERDKQEKSIERAKRKYPEVTSEGELRDLANALEKKRNRLIALAMIVGGALAIAVACILPIQSITQIGIIMGGVLVVDGVMMGYASFKKKRDVVLDDDMKTFIDMEYLLTKDKKSNIGTIIKQSIGMGALVAFLYGRSDLGAFLLCTLVPLFFIALYWVFRIIKCRKNRARITNGTFKLLHTTLYDKEDETDVGTDAETTHTYYFIFRYQGRWNYKLQKIVRRFEFNKRELGDACCLLLFLNEKKGEYEIDSIFWDSETVIASKLSPYLATEEEIAQTNQHGARAYQEQTASTI